MGGCSFRYSKSVVTTALRLQVLLVCLPPNATLLLQPLDVAVFAPSKGNLRRLIDELVEEEESGAFSIDTATAIKLAYMGWARCRFARNLAAGFKACGLYLLSLVKMEERFGRYKQISTPIHVHIASWLVGSRHRRCGTCGGGWRR